MKLKIDSTDSQNVKVELIGISFKDEVSEKRLGSQILLPLIDKILKRNKKTLEDVKLIEVNTGPGSFTGTRVGVSVANALGFALDVPVNEDKIALPKYSKSKFD